MDELRRRVENRKFRSVGRRLVSSGFSLMELNETYSVSDEDISRLVEI